MKTSKSIIPLAGALSALAFVTGCETRSNTQRNAGIGAASGAVIGGVIGHQSGHATEGAVIGAAAGGLAGGAYGRRQDQARSANSNPAAITTPTSSADYMALMTADEIAILQQRAAGSNRTSYELTDFLTEAEKQNLRERAARQSEIGR